MPIYEYACGSCGHHFEARQRFNDIPIAHCPECGQTVRRVLHPAGIIFKGSGFYINDSRNGAKAPDAASKPDISSTAEASTKAKTTPETVNSTTTDSQ